LLDTKLLNYFRRSVISGGFCVIFMENGGSLGVKNELVSVTDKLIFRK
jgi:hypothetical protein